MQNNNTIDLHKNINTAFSKESIALFIVFTLMMLFSLYVQYNSTMSVLFQIVIIGILILGYKHPSMAIVAELLFSVTRRYILGTTSDLFTRYYNFNSKSMIFIILLLFAINMLFTKKHTVKKGAALLSIFFGVFLIISPAFATTSVEYSDAFYAECIMYIFIPFFINDEEDYRIILMGFIMSGLFMAIGSISHILSEGDMYTTRVMTDRNYQSGFLIICIFSCLAYLFDNYRRLIMVKKIILMAIIVADLFIMLSSASRGSFVAVVLGTLFVLVMNSRKPKVMFSVALIIGILSVIAVNAGWIDTLLRRFTLSNMSSANGRTIIWEQYLSAFNSSSTFRWLFGHGYVYQTDFGIVSHNNFIGILYGFGVFGVALFITMLCTIFVKLRKSPFRNLLIVLFPTIIMSLSIETFYYAEFVVLLVGAAGLSQTYFIGGKENVSMQHTGSITAF